MRASGAPVEEWPSVGSQAAGERLRRQLNVVGMKTIPMLPYTQRVVVKRKWWNRITEKAQNLSSPFWQATIKGPSPLMTHGWCVLTSTKKVQHARAVISTDPNSERAMLEFVDDPKKSSVRLTGRQRPQEHVRPPQSGV